MISYENGKVVSIIEKFNDAIWIKVNINGEIFKAINYTDLTGDIKEGDKVVLNTTAVNLSLGTGGQHFVIYNYGNPSKDLTGKGHIMKMRYTPNQVKVFTAEEESSPHHETIRNFKSLEGHPVIVASLHSMLAPITSVIKYKNPNLKITYIMTDSGALPMAFSNTVRDLKKKKIIENTITVGHAFGGDYECTNIYTGLITSKEIAKSDITIITMGPGIVGTGTKYGFSGIEQGEQVNAVNTLKGKAILVPRISFKDQRDRHQGLSHHTITVLNEIIKTDAKVILPNLKGDKLKRIKKQLEDNDLIDKYEFIYQDGGIVLEALEKYRLNTTTMGRGIDSDYEFFETMGAVGSYINSCINKE